MNVDALLNWLFSYSEEALQGSLGKNQAMRRLLKNPDEPSASAAPDRPAKKAVVH